MLVLNVKLSLYWKTQLNCLYNAVSLRKFYVTKSVNEKSCCLTAENAVERWSQEMGSFVSVTRSQPNSVQCVQANDTTVLEVRGTHLSPKQRSQAAKQASHNKLAPPTTTLPDTNHATKNNYNHDKYQYRRVSTIDVGTQTDEMAMPDMPETGKPLSRLRTCSTCVYIYVCT